MCLVLLWLLLLSLLLLLTNCYALSSTLWPLLFQWWRCALVFSNISIIWTIDYTCTLYTLCVYACVYWPDYYYYYYITWLEHSVCWTTTIVQLLAKPTTTDHHRLINRPNPNPYQQHYIPSIVSFPFRSNFLSLSYIYIFYRILSLVSASVRHFGLCD